MDGGVGGEDQTLGDRQHQRLVRQGRPRLRRARAVRAGGARPERHCLVQRQLHQLHRGNPLRRRQKLRLPVVDRRI